MLCSNCSEVIKPVVALDIDGTLGDYHRHFIDFARGYLDADPWVQYNEMYDGRERFSEWFTAAFSVDLSTFRAIKLAYRQGAMKRTMRVFPGARNLVDRLHDAGAEVWLTTTRPHDRFDRVDPDTRHWLHRHGIRFDGLLFSGDKMAELAQRVDPARVVAVLDDQRDALEEASAYFAGDWGSILRRTLYNQAVQWPCEVSNLADAWIVINQRLVDWRAKEMR